MKTLFITIGISGSGKSRLSERIKAALDVDYHSSDAIRGELCHGDMTDQSKNGLVFKVLHERIEKSLSEDRSVIADSTAVSKKSRSEFRKIALKHGARTVALVMTTSLDESIQYNNERDRKVPIDVIERQFGNLVVPSTEEINEIAYVSWKEDIVQLQLPNTFAFEQFFTEDFIKRYGK